MADNEIRKIESQLTLLELVATALENNVEPKRILFAERQCLAAIEAGGNAVGIIMTWLEAMGDHSG